MRVFKIIASVLDGRIEDNELKEFKWMTTNDKEQLRAMSSCFNGGLFWHFEAKTKPKRNECLLCKWIQLNTRLHMVSSAHMPPISLCVWAPRKKSSSSNGFLKNQIWKKNVHCKSCQRARNFPEIVFGARLSCFYVPKSESEGSGKMFLCGTDVSLWHLYAKHRENPNRPFHPSCFAT